MTNTTTTDSALEALAAETAAGLPSGHTASGIPLCRSTRIIGGCRVICRVWDGIARFEVTLPSFEIVVPASPEGLTLAEAQAAVNEAAR